MKKIVLPAILMMLMCCGIANAGISAVTVTYPPKYVAPVRDTTIKFLWRNNKYNETLKDTVSSIFINEAYCRSIPGAEKAALAYLETFISNECDWDGAANDSRSNLKCRILTDLNLGYQCSDTHLGFLKQWFRNDKKALTELESCPTTPDGATTQETFDAITLTVKGNKISVSFSASGSNMRDNSAWTWTETDFFETEPDNSIKLAKTVKSKIKYTTLDAGE